MTPHSHIAVPFDAANPPEGHRLNLGLIAAHLGITITEMAAVSGISRTAVARLLSNEWPVKTDRAALARTLRDYFAERGATADDLATLFHGHVNSNNRGKRPYAVPVPTPGTRGVPRTPTSRRSRARVSPPQEEEIDTMLLPKQTLGPAARRAFQLFTNPFDGDVMNDDDMFVNAEIGYVREACLQAAINSRFVAVVSESGGGKTTIATDLEARILRDRKPVIVIRPSVLGMEDSNTAGKALKAADILAAVITTLDPLATPKLTLEARSKQARDKLTTSVEAGFQHLLVIEEAHSMPDATLKHLKRLHELKLGRRPLLGILLVAQPELKLKLSPSRAHLREVTQRCEMVELLPLDADLKPYLAHRAQAAGSELAKLIDDSGVEELRRRLTIERPGPNGQRRATSLLYPLAVNNMMTAALNMAAELGAPLVNRDVVRAV